MFDGCPPTNACIYSGAPVIGVPGAIITSGDPPPTTNAYITGSGGGSGSATITSTPDPAISTVPEPSSGLLLLTGMVMAALVVSVRRKLNG